MKFIRLYEAHSGGYIPVYIQEEIKDMSTELLDDGYRIGHNFSFGAISNFNDYSYVSISRRENNTQVVFHYQLIKQYVDRVRKYLNEEGYKTKVIYGANHDIELTSEEESAHSFVIRIYKK